MTINGFEMQVVCANYDASIGNYRDIYTSVEECVKEHPKDMIMYGFVLEKPGVETPDWFGTVAEAADWAVHYNHKLKENNVENGKPRTAILYTDGSYNKGLGIYGCGMVLLDMDGVEITRRNKSGIPSEGQNGWNINGEVAAAMMGIKLAIDLGYKNIKVYHDYEGVGKWPDNLWKANKPYTKDYAETIKNWRNSGVNIQFFHVKGHNGNKWNEIADQQAKIGAKLA